MSAPRVMIIDDSALMRQLLTTLLAERGCQVVGSAADPVSAAQRIPQLKPDVLTLDVEMPRMNGLDFLARLMRTAPLPVVMVSSLTEKGAETTLRALELGAVDFVTKPTVDVSAGTEALADEIAKKVRMAAKTQVRRRVGPPPAQAAPASKMDPKVIRTTDRVICIGASTGGTEALKEVLCALPADAPGVVIVQHMPEQFTKQFAERLDQLTALHAAEAVHGERVMAGHIYLAPGNRHLRIGRSGATYTLALSDEAPVGHHRPSVDVLFHSAAQALGRNAVAAILTGMGADGAQGMKAMRDAGARTVAQDEATSVVYGMPKEAVALGGVEQVLPLKNIARALLQLARAS